MTRLLRHSGFSLQGLLGPLLLGAICAAGIGCTTSSDNGAEPALGEVSDQEGLTAFAQALRAADGQGEVVPGFANMWEIERNFSISTGASDQFSGGLSLRVDLTDFPSDQNYNELVFMTPELGTADGIVPGVVYDGTLSGESVATGSYSLAVAPTQSSRILQTLDLNGAVAPVSLTFLHDVTAVTSNFTTEPYSVEVLIKDTANSTLEQVFYRGPDPDVGTGSFDLSAYVGEVVRLTIEARMTPHSLALFDEFSVKDDDDVEYVVNGGFETGTPSGWSRNTPRFVRNVTSGMRVLESLEVTRSFFTTPTSRWGRMVDVFTNPTGATIDETITYEIDLGSNGEGIIYDTFVAPSPAVTTWDSLTPGKRDIGWAFGDATSVAWISDDALGASGNGNDIITVTFDISVPAGQSVALAQFLVLDNDSTGRTASSVNDAAVTVDDVLQDIVDGWPVGGVVNEYTNGMTQAQIDAVMNF